MNIEKHKNNDVIKAIIYATALNALKLNKTNELNRRYLLMEFYEKIGLDAVCEEILCSLKGLCVEYPDSAEPNYYLGEYYLDKDIDRAKLYLRNCLKKSNRNYPGKQQKHYQIFDSVSVACSTMLSY